MGYKITRLEHHNTKRIRVTMWCELLKAILDNRPLTLLERNTSSSPRLSTDHSSSPRLTQSVSTQTRAPQPQQLSLPIQ